MIYIRDKFLLMGHYQFKFWGGRDLVRVN